LTLTQSATLTVRNAEKHSESGPPRRRAACQHFLSFSPSFFFLLLLFINAETRNRRIALNRAEIIQAASIGRSDQTERAAENPNPRGHGYFSLFTKYVVCY